jgi:cold shock CspA family protein
MKTNKKFITGMLAMALVYGMVGCSKQSTNKGGEGKTITVTPAPTSAQTSTGNAQADTQPQSIAAIEISPEDLYETYENNEVKADSTYKGKNIRMVGVVDDIGKDMFNQPYIKFSVDSYGFNDIQIYFKTSEQSKLGELNKGQKVSIVGVCDGKGFMSVNIKNAVLETITATPAPTSAQTSTSNAQANIQPQSGATIEISPEDLYEAYENNEVKADNTYKGKNIRMVGIVDDIGKDMFNQPYVKFSVDSYGFNDIQVYFKNSELSKLGELNKGQKISVVGVCDGKSILSVDIKNAIIE